MSKQKLTWKELKDFCNSLTEEQLGERVAAWGEYKFFEFDKPEILEDDFINPSGEGAEPAYLYKDEPEILSDEPLVGRKGEPRLVIKETI